MAAQQLVGVLATVDGPQAAHRFLRQLADALGDEHFPALIKLFSIVGQSHDEAAKRSLAKGFLAALQRGDLPAGMIGGWGTASGIDSAVTPLMRGVSAVPGFRLEPIAYLCNWYSNASANGALSERSFVTTLADVLRVFESADDARQMYQKRIAADAATLPEGAISERTRKMLERVAQGLAYKEPADLLAKAVGALVKQKARTVDLAREQLFNFDRGA